jgi:hypothetical protein
MNMLIFGIRRKDKYFWEILSRSSEALPTQVARFLN